jgi:hypothetical protein
LSSDPLDADPVENTVDNVNGLLEHTMYDLNNEA